MLRYGPRACVRLGRPQFSLDASLRACDEDYEEDAKCFPHKRAMRVGAFRSHTTQV